MYEFRGTPKKLPNVLNTEQLGKLFDEIEDPQTLIGSLLGFFCGMRISEVISLRVRDLDFEKQRIRIEKGKGGKTAYVVMPPQLERPLNLWLDLIGKQHWLFPSQLKKGHCITRSDMYRKFKKALARAGLSIEVGRVEYKAGNGAKYEQPRYMYYFHTLRHSYATYLYEKGVDIATVSKCLRHNFVDTTMIYTHICDRQRKEAVHKAFHTTSMPSPEMEKSSENPLDTLQRRLVTGEITVGEFNTRLDALKRLGQFVEVTAK